MSQAAYPPPQHGQPSGCHQPLVLIEGFALRHTSLSCLLGCCIAMMFQRLQVIYPA